MTDDTREILRALLLIVRELATSEKDHAADCWIMQHYEQDDPPSYPEPRCTCGAWDCNREADERLKKIDGLLRKVKP